LSTGFDFKFWNLSQVAAWIVFRNRSVVDNFDGTSAETWHAHMFYPKMWNCEPVGELSDLHDALVNGRLAAMGHADHAGANMSIIPAIEWETLILDPPSAYRRLSNNVKAVPWHDIRIVSADVRKTWRGTTEVSSRSRYDWAVIKSIFLRAQTRNPEFSRNELIAETQQEFQDRFNKEPPSRTSLQRNISKWT
jgi:hypothetical protein